MLHQRDTELLLLPWSVDVCDEERNIMATYHRHETGIVKMTHVSLSFPAIGGGVRILTLLDDLFRYSRAVFSRGAFTGRVDPLSDGINLRFWYYLSGIMEVGAVTGGGLMTMVKVTI